MGQRSYFFAPTTAFQYSQQFVQAWSGNKIYVADNPPYGATLTYRLAAGTARDTARVVITDVKGDVVRRLTGSGAAGINRVTWDLRGYAAAAGSRSVSRQHRCRAGETAARRFTSFRAR